MRDSTRIDGLMFHSLQRTAIEVKVSVADFRRETHAKQRAWIRCTHRFVFAVPAGLIDAADVALEFYYAGLWWVHPDGRVEVRRKATIQKYPEPLPQQLIQSLAYRAARVAAIDAGLAEVETAEATQCADQRSEATPTC